MDDKPLDSPVAEMLRAQLLAFGNAATQSGIDPDDFVTALLAAAVDCAGSLYGKSTSLDWIEMNTRRLRGLTAPAQGGLQ
jgi:hypothetical protein